MKNFILISVIALSACSSMKGPSVSGNPQRMSADTLCFRAEGAKSDPALKEEVRARRLDCAAILESQPSYDNMRY